MSFLNPYHYAFFIILYYNIMKNYCFHVQGFPICSERDLTPILTGKTDYLEHIPHSTIAIPRKPIRHINEGIPRKPIRHINEGIDKYLNDNVDDKHHENIKKILHPFFVDNVTKPNIKTIPENVRERAIFNRAAELYGKHDASVREQIVERYLGEKGIGE
ncbi:MAG: hypothetical protein HWN80_20550, partial [Candidatus Lokiarchaeota archaeon]|nr:hypothetical protein [Candidatus Lokiarchaeota archaeon]